MGSIGIRATRRRALACLIGSPLGLCAAWPEFRGPGGQGLADQGQVPLSWSEDSNVAWKTPVPGRGWSSPVTLGPSKIWLTAATEEGRSLRALSFAFDSGEAIDDVEVFRREEPLQQHEKNSHASPTPLLEDDRVYVHFGVQGTAALDFQGQVLWRNQEHTFEPVHGAGGSPVLWEDLLIFTCDGTDKQYVAALDKNTGETRWTASRGGGRMSFATPLVIHPDAGPQVVCPGGDVTAAYHPGTGEEIWRVVYDGFSVVPRPVYAHGLVYIVTGFYTPTVLAIRPDGEGDVTATHIVWKESRGAPLTPSPIVVGDDLYVVSDNGIASCLEAATGQRWWQARLGGSVSASPIALGGRLYFTSENGETTVVEAAREYRELSKSSVDGSVLASLAVEGESLLLRSETDLYRIESLQ